MDQAPLHPRYRPSGRSRGARRWSRSLQCRRSRPLVRTGRQQRFQYLGQERVPALHRLSGPHDGADSGMYFLRRGLGHPIRHDNSSMRSLLTRSAESPVPEHPPQANGEDRGDLGRVYECRLQCHSASGRRRV